MSEARTIPLHEVIIVPQVGQAGREELRQLCYDLRIVVFHYEQLFPLESEIDETDETATHILLRLVPSLKPVGTIRAVKLGESEYRLRSLVVLKDYRKYGFGRVLVSALHNWVKQDANGKGHDVVQIFSHSQIPVKGFYVKFGYKPEGEEFEEDGAPHQNMVLHLSLEGGTDRYLRIEK